MVRSKFPGKPSKHVNRKRVNVLPPNGEATNIDDSVTVTEDKEVNIKLFILSGCNFCCCFLLHIFIFRFPIATHQLVLRTML